MGRNSTYYEGDLRRDLLDAALAAIHEVGPAQVSIRQLARSLGVSHAAPANHFPDKQALFTAIAAEGFELLGRTFVDGLDALDDQADWAERLRARGRAYVAFALRHEAHFEVMWRTDLVDRDDPALIASSAATMDFLVTGVGEAQRAGWNVGENPRTVAIMLWSVVHGLATLWLRGPLPAQLDDGIDELVDDVIRLTTVPRPDPQP